VRQNWPKKPFSWSIGGILYVSVPFTWNLPELREALRQRSFLWDKCVIGGPATKVMPDFFSDMNHVVVKKNQNGILQKINPYATRTTFGCPHSCGFCAVNLIEGEFRELQDWPDLPIITDSNILACSINHFDRVMNRLEKHTGVDFNQGLDIRFLNKYHAERLARLDNPIIRLSLDSDVLTDLFSEKIELLLTTGIRKKQIRAFALIGFDSGPLECWERCDRLVRLGLWTYPMWYHALDCLEWNSVSEEQKKLGWTDKERRRIMDWYYNRSGTSPLKA
jgi:hypothetical protein